MMKELVQRWFEDLESGKIAGSYRHEDFGAYSEICISIISL